MKPDLLRLTRATALAAAVLAGAAGGAHAVAVASGNTAPDAPARGAVAAPAPGADAAAPSLLAARIDAVDANAGTITLRGRPVPLHPTQLRVLGPRGQALGGARALRAGMQVRLALEPETPVIASPAAVAGTRQPAVPAPAPRRVVLIYVDTP